MDMTSKQLDQLVTRKFGASLMSNAKWEKLIDSVTDVVGEVFLNYKLVHEDTVSTASFCHSDSTPFFIEPIVYKEVEWVEFLFEYEDYINRNNYKAGKAIKSQDVEAIEKAMADLGEFHTEHTSTGIKLYAYK